MGRKKVLDTRNEQPSVIISCNTAWNVFSRRRLLSSLAADGWNVITLAADDPCADRIRKELSLPFISLPMENDSTSIIQDARLFFRFVFLYRKYRPATVLHINNKPNIYGTIAASMLGIPSISNITGLGIVAEKTGFMKKLVYGLYRIAFSSKKARVFFQNTDDRDFFLKNKLVAADKTRVIPGSGVDTDFFSPDGQDKQSDEKTRFLYTGRLLISKGIEDFLDAAERTRRLYPATTFTIIGEHDPGNDIFISGEKLESAISAGIAEYKGNVQSVVTELAAADCVVLPSRYREGVPRSLLEAAAMGKPIIAADSVGTREPVEQGKNGFLVPPSNPQLLAETMMDFIRLNSEQKKRMGIESRRIAVERFSDSIVIKAYHELIEAMSGKHNKDSQ